MKIGQPSGGLFWIVACMCPISCPHLHSRGEDWKGRLVHEDAKKEGLLLGWCCFPRRSVILNRGHHKCRLVCRPCGVPRNQSKYTRKIWRKPEKLLVLCGISWGWLKLHSLPEKSLEDEYGVLCQDLEEGALHLLMHPTNAPFKGPLFQSISGGWVP